MTAKPYHVLDGGKVRCHVCGKLLRWVDAAETEIGYACEDHVLQEDDDMQAEPVHRCECGCEDGITETIGCIPIMSWCAKCGKAYDPWNNFARTPGEDRTPEGGERR